MTSSAFRLVKMSFPIYRTSCSSESLRFELTLLLLLKRHLRLGETSWANIHASSHWWVHLPSHAHRTSHGHLSCSSLTLANHRSSSHLIHSLRSSWSRSKFLHNCWLLLKLRKLWLLWLSWPSLVKLRELWIRWLLPELWSHRSHILHSSHSHSSRHPPSHSACHSSWHSSTHASSHSCTHSSRSSHVHTIHITHRPWKCHISLHI